MTKTTESQAVALPGGTAARRERRVLRAGELTDEEIAVIAKAEVPAKHDHLDEKLKDWRP